MDRDDDLRATSALLRSTFGDSKYADESLLRWEYVDAPEGPVVESNCDDDGVRLGHYAVVPQRYVRGSETLSAALSLNTAVAEAARGRSLFTTLAAETFDRARASGIDAVYGVANANSTPGFVGRLGFTLVMPLPPVVCVPTRPAPRGTVVVEATPEYLASGELRSLHESLELGATTGWVRHWDLPTLRWRLDSPHARYHVVATPEVVGVVDVTKAHGVRVVAILKLFARRDAAAPSAAGVVGAACSRLRAPIAVYAGFNARVKVKGVPIPRRLRPSPLNLIARSLDPDRSVADLGLETFEFLDFDAY